MTISVETSTTELAVPKPARSAVGSTVFFTFVGFSVLLACYNLFHFEAIIPSICWLLFVGFLLFDSCRLKGTRQVSIEILGSFALREFVWATNQTGFCEIQFGYRIFGRRFFYRKIVADKIENVSWSTGQASGMAGHDMNDWRVAVRYDHGDIHKPNHRYYMVGPRGRKKDIAAFGHALVKFLEQTGVPLVRGDSENIFFRAT